MKFSLSHDTEISTYVRLFERAMNDTVEPGIPLEASSAIFCTRQGAERLSRNMGLASVCPSCTLAELERQFQIRQVVSISVTLYSEQPGYSKQGIYCYIGED